MYAFRVQDFHLLRLTFPGYSAKLIIALGLIRVRSPLLTESQLISFPTGTKMFQFPAFASRLSRDDMPSTCRVAPFGNLRIKVYVPLPAAYRSLSRPSSPLEA